MKNLPTDAAASEIALTAYTLRELLRVNGAASLLVSSLVGLNFERCCCVS